MASFWRFGMSLRNEGPALRVERAPTLGWPARLHFYSTVLMSNDEILKIAYEAAWAAFRDVADQNVRIAINGGYPTIKGLQYEEDAQNEFAVALDAYLNSYSRRAPKRVVN